LSRILDSIFFCFNFSLGLFLLLVNIFFISSLFLIFSCFSTFNSFFVFGFLLCSIVFCFLKFSFHFGHPFDILKEILKFAEVDESLVVLIVEFILLLSKLIFFIPMLFFLIANSFEIFIKFTQSFVFDISILSMFVHFKLKIFQFLKDFWNWALNFLGARVDFVNFLFNSISLFDMRFRLSDQLLSLNDGIFHLEIA
jgi:hypothetical protein